MIIAVVDGQGGGIGEAIIRRLREELPEDVTILALGTNAVAVARMLRAGANDGASGDNAIAHNVPGVDVIVGTVSVVMANSMMGELTPKMAEAISTSGARKILIPLSRSPVEVVGVVPEPLPHYVDMVLERIAAMLEEVT